MSDTVLQQFIRQTPLIDTHEHLIEESRRLVPPREGDSKYPCLDWAYLFHHYAADDLVSAGMTPEESKRFFSPNTDPADKWRLFQPHFERSRNTGYVRAVLITIRELYGIDQLNAATAVQVTEKMRAMVKPGFYRTILRDVANIESCQVNSLEHVFCETQYPDLMKQDLSIVGMSIWMDLKLGEKAGIEARTLNDWHRVIDWWFNEYGPKAIAVKNQGAYFRRLNYEDVSALDVAPLFERHARGEKFDGVEMKPLQDHLFHYCVRKATEFNLPVKLHTGYYVGNNRMPLERVRQNAADLCPVLQAHPKAKFVLMHINYPYQDEMIALAKHYPNVYVDLCWAWIINPLACVRFLKEALVAAPAHKFFGFGGDYYVVEPVVGHAAIARQGITQALMELMQERWCTEDEVIELAARIMHKNAREVFSL